MTEGNIEGGSFYSKEDVEPDKQDVQEGHQFMTSDDIQYAYETRTNLYQKVTEDIIADLERLESNINWQELLDSLSFRTHYGKQSGKVGISRTVARTISSASRVVGWDMDSPEIVYAIGYRFLESLEQSYQSLEEYFKSVQKGEIKFLTPEAEEKRLKEKGEQLGKFKAAHRKLEESLSVYADQQLPENKKHLSILRNIGRPQRGRDYKRNQGLKYLKRWRETGDDALLNKAYDIFVPEKMKH